MIHHISIPAKNPSKVASVIAEIFQGHINKFGPRPGAFMVWFGDDYGSAIEVYPSDTYMKPGSEDEACVFFDGEVQTYGAVHAAISVSCNKETLVQIADREVWRAQEFRRGSFRVIEFWLENTFMLELLTEDMAQEYLDLANKYREKK